MRPQLALALVIMLGSVAGCGQKAALYLPDDAPEAVAAEVATTPDSAEAAANTDRANEERKRAH
jgi:predicted small lipoprotein YifL